MGVSSGFQLVQKLSIETEGQSLDFARHQAISRLRLFGNLTSAASSRSLAIDEFLLWAYKAVADLVANYFEHKRLGKALWGMDAHLLDDIGLNRSREGTLEFL